VLNKGYYYEDIVPKKYEDRSKMPFAKSSFKKQIINIDLSELNKVDVNDESVANTNTMLTVNELNYTLDSLNKNMKTDIITFTENSNARIGFPEKKKSVRAAKKSKPLPDDILSLYTNQQKSDILKIASSNVISTSYSIDSSKTELFNKQKNINRHLLAFYDKFVIVYACFLMFFIGAPLGAIIRKGGLGLPIVFAVFIFITFHFINTFGKRIAQENGMTPFMGAWLSSFILTPLAILLTYRATNDIGLINMDVILAPFQKVIKKIFPSQN
jgi:lipopolysaccharide export system permease protein